MRVINSVTDMQRWSRDARARGRSLALVPTMGALHEGHLALIRQARRQADSVVVSVFVNPRQFDSGEDLTRYPRNLDHDLELLQPLKIDAVFAPSEQEIYPEGSTTLVDTGEISLPLEGRFRNGHFRGVATVVVKLFNIIHPDVAYFGQKDFQQTLVVRRLLEDLNLEVRLVICPIVREPDGLAISSRNALLGPDERCAALVIHRALQRAEELAQSGESDAANLLAEIERILASDSRLQADYAAIVEPLHLTPVQRVTPGCVALIAARVGKVRLIDNLILGPPDTAPDLLIQLALTTQPLMDTGALLPGFETEAVQRKVAACRECAAISTILLPPREYLSKHIRNNYPDRNQPRVAVIGRDSPASSEHFLYVRPEDVTRFSRGLFELVGVSTFAEFRKRFILTDALRCHCTGPRIPERALAYCARLLVDELKLFPNLHTLVILGEDAYAQFQQYVLGRGPGEFKPLDGLLGQQGWAREDVHVPILGDKQFHVYYCYHPTYGYKRSPSIAASLAG